MVNCLALGEFKLEYFRVTSPFQSLFLKFRDMIMSLEYCYLFFSSLGVQFIGFTVQLIHLGTTLAPKISFRNFWNCTFWRLLGLSDTQCNWKHGRDLGQGLSHQSFLLHG